MPFEIVQNFRFFSHSSVNYFSWISPPHPHTQGAPISDPPTLAPPLEHYTNGGASQPLFTCYRKGKHRKDPLALLQAGAARPTPYPCKAKRPLDLVGA